MLDADSHEPLNLVGIGVGHSPLDIRDSTAKSPLRKCFLAH